MRILYDKEIPARLWEDLAEVSLHATPFQTELFFNAFNAVDTLYAKALAVEENDLLLSLVVITFQKEVGLQGFFSSRAIIYGGPLIRPGYPDALDLLLEHVAETVRGKVIYTETRNLTDYNHLKELFNRHGWEYVPYINFRLNTHDQTAMTGAISESRLRQIKKALKSGVTWEPAKTTADVRAFYSLLTELYTGKIGKPLLPSEFFESFHKMNLGVILLVKFRDEIIGGIVCPVFQKRAIYEMYICGRDKDFKEQYPSIIATWAGMNYAKENGIRTFDFMGAGKAGDNYGVREFKARFGGELVEYGRFIRINRPLLYRLGKAVIKYRAMIRR